MENNKIESKLKHLEMIQAIINRLANNSFLIKGWCITIITALFTLASKDANNRFVIVSFFPCIIFWILDSYFLWQERLFRSLYDEVRSKPNLEIDFSMSHSKIALKKYFHHVINERQAREGARM